MKRTPRILHSKAEIHNLLERAYARNVLAAIEERQKGGLRWTAAIEEF
jgi:hypothetical protein